MSLDSMGGALATPAVCLTGRAGSLARRLLGGAGVMSLFSYRDVPQQGISTSAHWRVAEGVTLVVLPPSELATWQRIVMGEKIEVRLDVALHASTLELKLISAAAHGLAVLDCPSVPETGAALTCGRTPRSFLMAAAVDGARIARVHFDRLVLHDATGIFTLMAEDLVDDSSFPGQAEEYQAAEAVYCLGEDWRARLYARVLAGEVAGTVHVPAVLPRLRRDSAPDLVDVDAHGITLIKVDAEQTRTVYAPFGHPVSDAAQLAASLEKLAQ